MPYVFRNSLILPDECRPHHITNVTFLLLSASLQGFSPDFVPANTYPPMLSMNKSFPDAPNMPVQFVRFQFHVPWFQMYNKHFYHFYDVFSGRHLIPRPRQWFPPANKISEQNDLLFEAQSFLPDEAVHKRTLLPLPHPDSSAPLFQAVPSFHDKCVHDCHA